MTQAIIAAFHGYNDLAQTRAAEAEAIAVRSGTTFMLCWVQAARGIAALARGDYTVAYEELRRVFNVADPSYHWFGKWWLIGELVEAALRCGRRAEARAATAELEVVVAEAPSLHLQVGLRYARALLADDDDAEALYQRALDSDLPTWPFYRARASLAYGQWLRRQHRVAESRAPLRVARDGFDAAED